MGKMRVEMIWVLLVWWLNSYRGAVMAANYTVGGDNGGWDQSTDLASWPSSQTFYPGDFLIFRYTLNHDVTEVSAADYGSCSASNPLRPPSSGGLTVIPLTATGSRYFICGTAGHCLSGMKLQVTTVATATTPPPSTTPVIPSPPETPSSGQPASSPPPKSPKVQLPKEKKASASSPASPPATPTPPPPRGSLSPPPASSSAAKFDFMGAIAAASAGFLIMLA